MIFNEGPFYPGLYSDAEKDAIKKSHLWKIAMGVHYSNAAELYIEHYRYATGGIGPAITMCNKLGAGVLHIDSVPDVRSMALMVPAHGMYRVFLLNNNGGISRKPLLKSKNGRYIINKIGTVGGSADKAIKDFRIRAEDYLIRDSLTTVRYRFNRDNNVNLRANVHMDSDLQRELLFAYYGDITSYPVNTSLAQDIFNTYMRQKAENDVGMAAANELMYRDKWMIGLMQAKNVLLCGAVKLDLSGSWTNIIPVHMYRNFNCLDPAFKNELMGAYTMFKLHAETKINWKIYDATSSSPSTTSITLSTTSITFPSSSSQLEVLADAGALLWEDNNVIWLLLDKV